MKINKAIVDYIVNEGYEWQRKMVDFLKDAIERGRLKPWE